jgi:hypothetical protein
MVGGEHKGKVGGAACLPAMTIFDSHLLPTSQMKVLCIETVCLATTHANAQIQFYSFIQTLHAMNTARDTDDQTHHSKENGECDKNSSSQNPLSSMKKTIDL